MGRREKGEELYKSRFDEKGLSDDFEYLGRLWEKPHDKRFRVRCKNCGQVLVRDPDIFKGKTKSIHCPECGNGTKLKSPQVESMLTFYQMGHSIKETAGEYGTSISTVQNYIKRAKVSNGRRFETVANLERMTKAKPKLNEVLKTKRIVLLEPWKGKKHEYNVLFIDTGVIRQIRGSSLFRGCSNRSAERKAILKDALVDKGINIHKLIKRDGARCYICGKETTFDDLSWRNWGPNYPSIDHVIPLSRGGVHSWDNVRVCCGECNVMKGAN